MRSIKGFFSILFGFALAVLLTLLIAPSFVDWSRFRPEIERQITSLLGRDIRVIGNMSFQILPAPSISVDKITLANSASSQSGPIFIGGLNLRMDPAALINGDVSFTHVHMVRPVLTLERFSDGKDNWGFFREFSRRASSKGGPGILDNIRLDSVSIENGVLRYIDHKRRWVNVLRNVQASVSADSLIGPFRGELRFTYDGVTYEGRASASRFVSGKAVPFDLELQGKENALKTIVSALLTKETTARGLDGTVIFEAPSVAWLLRPSDEEKARQANNPVRIEAGFSLNDGNVSMHDIRVSLNGVSLEGYAQTEWEGSRSGLNLILKGSALNVKSVFGEDDGRASAFPAAKSLTHFTSIARLTERLSAKLPRDMTLAMDLQLQSLVYEGGVLRDIRFLQTAHHGDTEKIVLKSDLPARSRFSFAIEKEPESNIFVGDLSLQSPAPKLLFLWLVGERAEFAQALKKLSASELAPLAISSAVRFSESESHWENIDLRLGSMQIFGEASYGREGFSPLRARLDVKNWDWGVWRAAIGASMSASIGASMGASMRDILRGGDWESAWLKGPAMDVELRGENIRFRDQVFSEWPLKFRLQNQKIHLDQFRLAMADGGSLSLLGWADFSKDAPELQAMMEWNLANLQTLERLGGMALFSSAQREALGRSSGKASLESSKDSATNALKLSLEGQANDSLITLHMELQKWLSPERAFDMDMRVSNPSGSLLLGQLGLANALSQTRKGVFSVSAEGGFQKPVQIESSFALGEESQDQYAFAGSAAWKDGALNLLEGKISAKASAYRAFDALGLGKIPHWKDLPFVLEAEMEKDKNLFVIRGISLNILGGDIQGHGTYAHRGGDGYLEADLTSDLFPLYLLWPEGDQTWSHRPLPFSLFQKMTGTVSLFAKRARATDFFLDALNLQLDLSPERIKIDDITAKLAGGDLRGSLLLPLDGASDIKGDFSLMNAALQEMTTMFWKKPFLSGLLDISGALSAKGRVPLSLVSSLKGKGAFLLRGGRVEGMNPAALYEKTQEIRDLQTLDRALHDAFSKGTASLKEIKGEMSLKNGILSATRLPLEADKVKGRADIYFDFPRFILDAELLFAPPPSLASSDIRWLAVGSLQAPALRIDSAAFREDFAARALEKGIVKLEESESLPSELIQILDLDKEEARSKWVFPPPAPQRPPSPDAKRESSDS